MRLLSGKTLSTTLVALGLVAFTGCKNDKSYTQPPQDDLTAPADPSMSLDEQQEMNEDVAEEMREGQGEAIEEQGDAVEDATDEVEDHMD